MVLKWTKQMVEVLTRMVSEGSSDKAIARGISTKKVPVTEFQVLYKRQKLHLSNSVENRTPAALVEQLRAEEAAKNRKVSFKRLVDRVDELERERAVWFALKELKADKDVKATKPGRVRAAAFGVLSDFHIDEVVLLEGVNGLNEYNKDIAKDRLTHWCNNIISLIRMKAKDTELTRFVLAILGDMISGHIHEELMETTWCAPEDAIIHITEWMIPIIRKIKGVCDEIGIPMTVICKVGNHSRTSKKIHISTEEGNNLEWIMYHIFRMHFPDINWIIERSHHTYYQCFGFWIRFHHGWMVNYNGGIGGVMIAMAKANDAWDKMVPFKVKLNVCGHWHTQMRAHDTIINGSGIGYNRFAISVKAKGEKPQQAFFLFTENGDVTGEYTVFLNR